MGVFRIDPSSDYTIFFGAVLIVLLIVIVALERASPRRQKARRTVKRGHGDQSGELID
jgi:hypothetical protein